MSFVDEFLKLPKPFVMPEEFADFARWSQSQGLDGQISTECQEVVFMAGGDAKDHFPEGYLPDPSRLYQLGYLGGDGTTLCLWIDDAGQQQVVVHGSGSGAALWAVFPSPLAVLKLLAVGYMEPAWAFEWSAPPEWEEAEDFAESEEALQPYRAWLKERFGIEIPATGIEALGLSTEEAEQWADEGPEGDPFNEWLLSAESAGGTESTEYTVAHQPSRPN